MMHRSSRLIRQPNPATERASVMSMTRSSCCARNADTTSTIHAARGGPSVDFCRLALLVGQRIRGGVFRVLLLEVGLQYARQRLIHLGHDWPHLAAERATNSASGVGGGAPVAALQHTDPAAAAKAVAARELNRPQQQLEADGAGVVVHG
eukprot:scaffold10185_cov66-Phaeocystis_antarctica.AAC.2